MHSHESYEAVIGLVSFNSNSETHMTMICDVRLIYGREPISPVFILCSAILSVTYLTAGTVNVCR